MRGQTWGKLALKCVAGRVAVGTCNRKKHAKHAIQQVACLFQRFNGVGKSRIEIATCYSIYFVEVTIESRFQCRLEIIIRNLVERRNLEWGFPVL